MDSAIRSDSERAEKHLTVLDNVSEEINSTQGTTMMPHWCRALKVYINNLSGVETDAFYDLAYALADEVASEADYIYENWTHERIAFRYIKMIYQNGRRQPKRQR